MLDSSHMHQSLLSAILESVGEGILVVDGKKVTHANQRFAEMWKIPPELMAAGDDEALLNYVLSQLVHANQFLAKVKRLYDTDEEDFDTLLFKDGRCFERISRPLLKDGNVAGRVWSFRDVTKLRNVEKALQQNRQRYRKLFQHSNDAIIVHNYSGRIVDVNSKALQLLQYEKREVLRLNLADIHPSELHLQTQRTLDATIENGHTTFYMPFKRKSGEVFHAVVSASCFEVGKEWLIQGIFREFEDRSKAEAEIARINNLNSPKPADTFR